MLGHTIYSSDEERYYRERGSTEVQKLTPYDSDAVSAAQAKVYDALMALTTSNAPHVEEARNALYKARMELDEAAYGFAEGLRVQVGADECHDCGADLTVEGVQYATWGGSREGKQFECMKCFDKKKATPEQAREIVAKLRGDNPNSIL